VNRRPVTFAILVVIVLVAIAMLTAPSQNFSFTQKDAVDASLKDAQQFASDSYPGTETYIEVASASNSTGKWKVEMFLSIAPHSKCPAMQKLYYELFPVTLRNETVVAANYCNARPISVAPDAIADSYAGSPAVRQAGTMGYLACAFMLPITDGQAAARYCPAIDAAAISDFASKNALKNGNWVVQWYKKSANNYLVGLDSAGAVLAEGDYAPGK
jgi:hypothetical protein